jgi:hypothetical protein
MTRTKNGAKLLLDLVKIYRWANCTWERLSTSFGLFTPSCISSTSRWMILLSTSAPMDKMAIDSGCGPSRSPLLSCGWTTQPGPSIIQFCGGPRRLNENKLRWGRVPIQTRCCRLQASSSDSKSPIGSQGHKCRLCKFSVADRRSKSQMALMQVLCRLYKFSVTDVDSLFPMEILCLRRRFSASSECFLVLFGKMRGKSWTQWINVEIPRQLYSITTQPGASAVNFMEATA